MYSKKSWGGPVDPFILVKFLNNTLPEGDDPTVSLLLFEWKDRKFIGVPNGETGENVRCATYALAFSIPAR